MRAVLGFVAGVGFMTLIMPPPPEATVVQAICGMGMMLVFTLLGVTWEICAAMHRKAQP